MHPPSEILTVLEAQIHHLDSHTGCLLHPPSEILTVLEAQIHHLDSHTNWMKTSG
jgi:hypothetical protein